MRGLMMDFPLSIPAIARRAETLFGDRGVASRRPDRQVTHTTYANVLERARRLSVALRQLGVATGDRVATLAWASQQHLEAYLGVPGAGAVLHTLNLRLHPDDLAYIVNDAADRVLIVDESLLPLFEQFRAHVALAHVIVLPSGSTWSGSTWGPALAGPSSTADPASGGSLQPTFIDYEALLAAADPAEYRDPDVHEDAAAAMCYTSGTTGRPKGVLYSHRAIVLHSLSSGLTDTMAIGQRDTIMPIVPMFHVNAWGLPFTGTLFGARQVFPGPYLDPKSILELLVTERVTLTAGVPTVWLGLLQELDRQPGAHDLSALRTIIVGGSAAPVSMIRGFKERHGLDVMQAWGMTEMTPIGTLSQLPPELDEAPPEERYRYRAAQGTPLPFVEIRARAAGGDVPWDGQTMGELEVRGPWVLAQYYNSEGPDDRFTADGWFRTGDIVTIRASGCIEITDRSKDLVKSGGEWISSVALETALMGHPAVAEAAVVAVPHPKWDERPLAVVVTKTGHDVTPEELREFLAPMFAKWWLPDAFEFTNEIPRTSVGKFKKSVLRDRFKDRYNDNS